VEAPSDDGAPAAKSRRIGDEAVEEAIAHRLTNFKAIRNPQKMIDTILQHIEAARTDLNDSLDELRDQVHEHASDAICHHDNMCDEYRKQLLAGEQQMELEANMSRLIARYLQASSGPIRKAFDALQAPTMMRPRVQP
jgi:wobble nucleotide-excising tRNase